MKHYKNTLTNEIYAYAADGSQDAYIKPELIPISDAELSSHRELKAAEAAARLSYTDKRLAEYPPMADYLDAVVKGDTAAQQAYIDACLAVKAKYPKP